MHGVGMSCMHAWLTGPPPGGAAASLARVVEVRGVREVMFVSLLNASTTSKVMCGGVKRCENLSAGHILPLNRHTGPVAQPWRRLSRPKSRSRRSRNGDRWAAIACIAQLGSATAVAVPRQLSRNGDSRRGTATAVAERRQPSPRRQLSRKGYEDHQSAT